MRADGNSDNGGLPITGVTVTPIAFPDPPLLNAAGVHQPFALRSIIEVHTGDGLVGLGETYGDAGHLALLRQAAAALATPELPTVDVFDLAAVHQRVAAAVGVADAPDRHGLTGPSSAAKTLLRVFSPFEVACLDAQGQAIGRPICDLLGGRFRDRVPYSAYLFYKWPAHPAARNGSADGSHAGSTRAGASGGSRAGAAGSRAKGNTAGGNGSGDGPEPDEWGAALDPEGIVAQARRMIDRYGFGSIKLKGGVFPPDEEIAAIRALRAAFPDHPLRLDPNCAWTVQTSLRVAEQTAGLLQYLEDPTPGIAGMAEVAARAPMPLATNMCVVEFGDVPEAFARGAVGVVLADHHYWGGLRMSARLAGICQTWGVGLSMHSNSHLGISLAAMTHLAAATENLGYAADTHTPWQCGVDLIEPRLSFVDGSVAVPSGAGLGVRLDRDALARMHEDYLRCGIRERDDASYLRQFQPDFENRPARW